jgi:RNA polymerase sigma factor (TIGR02999 family)
MSSPGPTDFTRILDAVGRGDEEALQRLFSVVYDELRRMAHGKMIRESADQTLQTTALVNEAYLRLCGGKKVSWENRRHFFGAAANAMRQILVDQARKRAAGIRGGGAIRVTLADDPSHPEPSLDILALEEALNRMARERPRHAEVVLHRYFLGLTVKETAEVLGVSPRTVNTDWNFAKSWLKREMTAEPPHENEGDRHER